MAPRSRVLAAVAAALILALAADQFRFQPLPASIVSLSDAQIAKIG